jgi:hypothetical protein
MLIIDLPLLSYFGYVILTLTILTMHACMHDENSLLKITLCSYRGELRANYIKYRLKYNYSRIFTRHYQLNSNPLTVSYIKGFN